MDVGVHSEARCRQQAFQRGDVVARETETVGQHQPALDAAVAGVLAVVIDDALAPDAAQLGILHPRQDGGIFNGDHRLVIEAVQRPGLNLFAVELAAVQHLMERVMDVVAAGADGAQFPVELVGRHEGVHKAISIPS